jgi:predicted nucleotidyltransferase
MTKIEGKRWIEAFCQRLVDAFQPDCIILHGSIARGTETPFSDVDIIVIGGLLPDDFFTRLYELNRLRDGTAPIEVIGYTLTEWEQMMNRLHLTTLEAIHWGIPLHGQALFSQWQTELDRLKATGLRRDAGSWSIPPTWEYE